jgi:sulfur relay (sulfurtransferase) DsrC/TusE family protein
LSGGILHALISRRGWPAVKRRAATTALVLLAALVAAGCTGAKVVYGQLDVLLPWYFRDYVELDTGQRSQLQRSIETLLAWHRETEVGRYAAFFRELSADAVAPLPPGRLEAARQDLETFWDDIARRVAPDAAALLATLSDEQVESLFERMAREDRDQARESAGRDREERVERRARSLTRQVERWTGRLDASQREVIAACARDLRGDTEGWLASRRAWQSALREALAAREDATALAARLGHLLADGEDFWVPSYRENFQADRQRVLRMLEDIDRSLSERQRTHLQGRLERWALDLDAIAGGA